MSFAGLRILSLESRRAAEIEILIRKQEGEAFVAPSVRERALDDHADAFRLLEAIEQNAFDMLILMTGVGLAFWRDLVATRYPMSRADEALRAVKLLARGPKPSALLRSIGLAPDVTVPEPNTWREIVTAVSRLPERRLAIQEYGRANPEFFASLRELGATVDCFALYRWDLPSDVRPLKEAAELLRAGQIDVVLFTSSVQLEHLLEIARQDGIQDEVLEALRSRVVVASIGPIMSETLQQSGIRADVVPSSPKMGALVKSAADEAPALMASKSSKRGGDDKSSYAGSGKWQ